MSKGVLIKYLASVVPGIHEKPGEQWLFLALCLHCPQKLFSF